MFDFASSMAVKVCGLTSVEDALVCAEAGIEMLGLNFSPQSVRCISPSLGREITTKIRARFSPRFVGVFVDQPAEFVEEISRDLNLDAVQLHGEESPSYLENLRVSKMIKALRVRTETPSAAGYSCDAILLDAWNESSPGGTGRTFPWKLAADFARDGCRLIADGKSRGLTSCCNAPKVCR